MKVWITKYALTNGIVEADAATVSRETVGVVGRVGARFRHEWFHKPDWCGTRAEAVTRAEQMRRSRIASLKKQLDRLEKLKFE